LHAADGGKDIARRAAELCGGAFVLYRKECFSCGKSSPCC
jgi:hypothetical protein